MAPCWRATQRRTCLPAAPPPPPPPDRSGRKGWDDIERECPKGAYRVRGDEDWLGSLPHVRQANKVNSIPSHPLFLFFLPFWVCIWDESKVCIACDSDHRHAGARVAHRGVRAERAIHHGPTCAGRLAQLRSSSLVFPRNKQHRNRCARSVEVVSEEGYIEKHMLQAKRASSITRTRVRAGEQNLHPREL